MDTSADLDVDTYAIADRYAGATHGNSYGDLHRDRNTDCHAYEYSYSDSHINAYRYSNSNTRSDRYANFNTD